MRARLTAAAAMCLIAGMRVADDAAHEPQDVFDGPSPAEPDPYTIRLDMRDVPVRRVKREPTREEVEAQEALTSRDYEPRLPQTAADVARIEAAQRRQAEKIARQAKGFRNG